MLVQATTGQFRPDLDQTRQYGEYNKIKKGTQMRKQHDLLVFYPVEAVIKFLSRLAS